MFLSKEIVLLSSELFYDSVSVSKYPVTTLSLLKLQTHKPEAELILLIVCLLMKQWIYYTWIKFCLLSMEILLLQ